MKRYLDNHLTARYLPSLALIFSLMLPLPSLAASLVLATSPLANATTTTVKPNLMFILDDSGSMSWTYMPDTTDDFRGGYGYVSSQCNGVYYNPAITYLPPLKADGTSYPNASFTAAQYDGYNTAASALNTGTGKGTVDLSSKFRADMYVPYSANATYGGLQDAAQAAYYYSYSGTQTTKDYSNNSSTFYKECNKSLGSSSTVFAKVTVGAGEQQNFANWYSYYRTRMLTMKTSASQAFSSVSSSFRVGYLSINNNTNSDFLNIKDFDSAQKAAWYAKLFAAIPENGTPLRSALSTAGLIYGGKMTASSFNGSTVIDPTQYSCQQNFALLATDGYWNTGNDSGCGNSRNGAGCKLNKTSGVGDQDDFPTPRPMYEGSIASSDSLADVAKYYYDTDLRDTSLGNCSGALGLDVCANNVFVSGTDNNVQQHMTSFTLGLGVDGTLTFSSDYKTATSGDYFDIKQGTKNWPKPKADDPSAVDDLWHAAVNGQGTYFSAKDPDQLTSGLSGALASIKSKVGSGATAATSTLNPVAGNNLAYVASYTTVKWTGNLEARSIDVSTGAVSEAATWCAEDVVLPAACTGTMASKVSTITDTRKIWMNNGTSLVDFTYANLSSAQKSNFNSAFLSANLSQWSALTSAQQTAAAGTNLVNFLRGQNGYEDRASNVAANRLYRLREAVLGDAVESTPVYIAKPTFSYTDPGYSAFKTAQASRAGTVYMGTNDGMLHAFNGSTGVERWAYVPSMVISNMWKLADKNYSTMHTYYANGSPIISDICTASCTDAATAVWRTILVAGLDGGGRGYYALDITNPSTPSLLWEFSTTSDNDLGYTFGDPVITKKADGTWVALITSGYNNTSPGNGQGYLYVLNVNTGSVISKIGTGVGATATPSGLAKIAAYADDAEKNNTATYIYGGDLLGNLWRFDISSGTVMKFAELKDSSSNPQPITTRPELGKIKGKRVVFVGTGKYLEIGDLTDTQQQTLYAIKDDNASATLVNPRTTLVAQTLTTSGANRTATNNTVDFTTGRGWFVDFPDSGERQNVAGQLVLGTLLIPTTVPLNTPCSPGGYGWLNYFNYKTGGRVIASSMVSSKTNAPIVGVNVFYINGMPKVSIVTSDHPTPDLVPGVPFATGSGGFQKKKVIWRELIQ